MDQVPALEARGLTKHFDQVPAVNEISFAVPQGSIVALLGGNGAGKTTTISMLLGLLLPTSGTARVLGHDMATERFKALPVMNFSSPYVDLPGELTVTENLKVYGRLYGVPALTARIEELAALLQLNDVLKRRVRELSAGQKTRVALAKALINAPKVLILDEPTASLDPDTGDWVRGVLSEYALSSQATIFFASHNMLEVERMCDDILMMKAGKIHDRGAPKDLIQKYGRASLEEVFLHIARGEAAA
ncbi:MAG: ABC transporter ATP-binding protein [Rhodospirillaceae bacterium]|nr:ABC transporter ATP-binding protein [Rhodospirillaceae bacterium]